MFIRLALLSLLTLIHATPLWWLPTGDFLGGVDRYGIVHPTTTAGNTTATVAAPKFKHNNPLQAGTSLAGMQLNDPGFEAQVGQISVNKQSPFAELLFRYRASRQHELLLSGNRLGYRFIEPTKSNYQRSYLMWMELEGANTDPQVETADAVPAKQQYFQANQQWETRCYKTIWLKDVYPGIDWQVQVQGSGVKYSFRVHPGADPSQIRMRFNKAANVQVEASGELVVSCALGQIREQAPVSFQLNKTIPTSFLVREHLVQFQVSGYNNNDTLLIDPSVLWSSFYGGTANDRAYSTCIDGNGNIYVAGDTESSTQIGDGGFDVSLTGSSDVFLVKFSTTGVRQWATYYGGAGEESDASCAVDGSDNVYLAGTTTTSTGIGPGGHQVTFGGITDAFLVKFNSAGSRQWATYYGGNSADDSKRCYCDGSNNVYLTGLTESSADIATSGAHDNSLSSTREVYLVKFNSSGVRQWGTYYARSGTSIEDMTVDGSNNIFLAGYTTASTNVAFSGYQNSLAGSTDAFLAKFTSAGVLSWATYYGNSSGTTIGRSCATDATGRVYLVGSTSASSGISSSASVHQSSYGGGSTDGFIVQFNSSGVRQFATYYGGSNSDVLYDGACDGNENLIAVGTSTSISGIADNGWQNNSSGGSGEGMVLKMNDAGVRGWGSYHGGSADELPTGVVAGGLNNIVVVGYTRSTDVFGSGGHQNTAGGLFDAFVTKINGSNFAIPVTLSYFDYRCSTTGIELVWQTETEINNRHFLLEKQIRQGVWEVLANLAGAGNSSTQRQYRWVDRTGSNGSVAYRLRQVDFDGTEKWSNELHVQCSEVLNQPGGMVFPNPSTGMFYLPNQAGGNRIWVTASDGRRVWTGLTTAGTTQVNLNGLPGGLYALTVSEPNGLRVQRIVIQ